MTGIVCATIEMAASPCMAQPTAMTPSVRSREKRETKTQKSHRGQVGSFSAEDESRILTGIVHLAVLPRGDEAHQDDLDDADEHGQPHEAHSDGYAPLLLLGYVFHLLDDPPGVDGEGDVGEEAGDGIAGVDPHDGGHGDAPPGQARVLVHGLADVHFQRSSRVSM